MTPRKPRAGLRMWGRVARRLLSPVYLAALAAILLFAVWVWLSNQPASYFALSCVFASIYITLALAWDFSSGLTGYLNFGLPFFFGIGAFTAGYFAWNGQRSLPLLLVLSLGFGLLGGLLFSLPTLRLRGPYFSLLSLLLPLIGADFVIAFWAQLGLPTEGYYSLPFLGANSEAELLFLSAVNGVLLTLFYLLRDSHFGLVLRGIRDDEEALGSQGIWTFPYKVVAFTLASGIAAFSGATYALVVTFAGLDTFGFTFILLPILIVILGGTGEIGGSVVAGYVVILLYQYLFQAFSSFTLIIFASVAILLVLFLPHGILRPLRTFVRFMRTPEVP
ncbi:MAG: branched-chain amino acid ABC transporter permease [Thermoplasmata archaeon]